MKNQILKTSILSILFIFISCNEKLAKPKTNLKQINGLASEYNEGDAKLNIMGFFVEPQLSGTISSNGAITLDLPENFNEISRKAFEEYNSLTDSQYELSSIGIEDIFSPLEGLEITGTRPQLALAGKYYGFETYEGEIKTGRVIPASSPEFIKFIMTPDKHSATSGHHYMFLFSDNALNIKGSNNTPISLDKNGNTDLSTVITYDVELIKGWNIVKYEVKDVVKDGNDILQIKNASFSTSTPQSVSNSWLYFPIN